METRFFKNNVKKDVRYELVNSVRSMMIDVDFDVDTFYSYLDKVISSVEDEHVYHLLRYLILTGPICYFGAVYYILKYNVLDDSCDEEFEYLKKFIDYEIDIYMVVNFLEFEEEQTVE